MDPFPAMRIFINVARDNRIHRQAHESRVDRRNREDAPHPERSQNAPNPFPVGADDVLDGVQAVLAVYEKQSLVASRSSFGPCWNC